MTPGMASWSVVFPFDVIKSRKQSGTIPDATSLLAGLRHMAQKVQASVITRAHHSEVQ
jgi:hypothetical protein